jgi:hypothetical protein
LPSENGTLVRNFCLSVYSRQSKWNPVIKILFLFLWVSEQFSFDHLTSCFVSALFLAVRNHAEMQLLYIY